MIPSSVEISCNEGLESFYTKQELTYLDIFLEKAGKAKAPLSPVVKSSILRWYEFCLDRDKMSHDPSGQ